jgi:hypothetical protein
VTSQGPARTPADGLDAYAPHRVKHRNLFPVVGDTRFLTMWSRELGLFVPVALVHTVHAGG